MSVEIVTFGCRLNAYESEVMRGLAHPAGETVGAETVIVNTCAVTAEAERQARQAIRRLTRERPDARIVVTGCAAQIDPAAGRRFPASTAYWATRRSSSRRVGPPVRARWSATS
jgi:threonylcarbamoyladenosine tRNA methylthiotransferase MtaB